MNIEQAMHGGPVGSAGHARGTDREMMKEDDIGAMPIGENDRLIGMVTGRDLALRTLANGSKYPATLTARYVMTKKKWSPPTRPPTHLFQEIFS